MPKITIHLPDEEPMKFGFETELEVNVGRAEDNDIVLDHDSISSHHAQLKLQGDRYHLIDLDSTNGTFLDGAVAENVPLHNGVKITFGQVDADYECEEPEEVDEEAESVGEFGESEGSGFESSVHAELAEQSVVPADFKNLSPIEKIVKKDSFSTIALFACILGLLAVVAVVVFTVTMKSPAP